jgi:hypothetical protein
VLCASSAGPGTQEKLLTLTHRTQIIEAVEKQVGRKRNKHKEACYGGLSQMQHLRKQLEIL